MTNNNQARSQQLVRESEVRDLIDRRTEGQHWDFKLEHHNSTADLIHDILCLANTEHRGQRYLIFGVDNNGHPSCDQTSSNKRRSLEDITSLFLDNQGKFFQDRFPVFYMFELEYTGVTLDVLVIEDRPYKPYYLTEEYKDSKAQPVHAHQIYSRKNSNNTPRTKTAAPDEIETMWRERFGLTLSPQERAILYLMDYENWVDSAWQQMGQYVRQYKDAPEFTTRWLDLGLIPYSEYEVKLPRVSSLPGKLDVTLKDLNRNPFEHVGSSYEWNQSKFGGHEPSCNSGIECYYYQTCLFRYPIIYFDDGHKQQVVLPDWQPRKRGRFYYFLDGSSRYAMNTFLFEGKNEPIYFDVQALKSDEELYKQAKAHWPRWQFTLPVVKPHELDDFLGGQQEQSNYAHKDPYVNSDPRQYHTFVRNLLEFERDYR